MSIATDLAAAIEPVAAPVETPAPEAPAPPSVDVSALQAELEAARKDIAAAKEVAAQVEQVRKIFTKTEEGTPLTAQDKQIRDEILRIVPEVRDAASAKEYVQKFQEIAKEAQKSIVERAWTYTQSLAKEHKLPEDPEAIAAIGSGMKAWIDADPQRYRRFATGDKEVIKEGFDHIVSKLYGPQRLAAKRAAVAKAQSAPVVPARGGVAGGFSAPSATKIDFSDKKSVREALRSSFVVSDE